jgi:hypothetical protein
MFCTCGENGRWGSFNAKQPCRRLKDEHRTTSAQGGRRRKKARFLPAARARTWAEELEESWEMASRSGSSFLCTYIPTKSIVLRGDEQ